MLFALSIRPEGPYLERLRNGSLMVRAGHCPEQNREAEPSMFPIFEMAMLGLSESCPAQPRQAEINGARAE